MPKITGQNIPPELATLYAALTSPGKATQGANGTTRLKKNKKKPLKPPKADLDLAAFEATAEQVKTELEAATKQPAPPGFVADLVRTLITGAIPTDYFKKCRVLQAVTLESIPTSVPDPNPPPYGFRTSQFLPTLPTYPDGTESTKQPTYTGAKSGTYFVDTLLAWRKIAYLADSLTHAAGAVRVLFRWNTTLTISATSRGSRPMFSRNVRANTCRQTGSALTSTKPPITAKTSLYWRFLLPSTTPPYFNATQYVRYIIPFARITKDSGTGDPFAYLVNASNRPMMGRGYNNNDNVETHYDADPELWEIRKCLGAKADTFAYATNPPAFEYQKVAWSPSLKLFAAVASNPFGGHIVTSPDAKTWTERPAGFGYALWGICWAEEVGLFVAVGGDSTAGAILTSANGINWTQRAAPAKVRYRSVAYSPALHRFVAVAEYSAAAQFAWSDDAITWHAVIPPSPGFYRSIAWSPELAIFAVCSAGGSGPDILTSTDGKTWTPAPSSKAAQWTDIAWSSDLHRFVVVQSYNGDDWICTSDDGVAWTTAHSGFFFSYESVVWAPDMGRFYAIGAGTGIPLTDSHMIQSPDGLQWSLVNMPLNKSWNGLAWAPDLCRLVAVNSNQTVQSIAST